ncbi:MAG TPA: 30S ribosomal protein S8 [Saprospirales bacterium]|nr:30S ribosomal protein S8 [Saprospirales bacterium]HAY70466.1 30S ribosomal protein S8 [Saprospirales bacterium]HRQ28461.1 30S ribosomal protein S8 [Saprospiraceae bacterium]
MAVTDPIADYLTRIRNAQTAGHRMLVIPGSKLKRKITEILYDQGYILKYKFEEDDKSGQIYIALKYDPLTKLPIIKKMGRISKPGLRKYAPVDKLPRIINGYGIAIVSTSKGIMTDKEARTKNVGGELICYIY